MSKWIVAMALLFVADVWLTMRILKQGGRELNPLLAKLFMSYDPLGVLIFAKAFALAIFIVFEPTISPDAKTWIGAGYVGLVVWNLTQVRR